MSGRTADSRRIAGGGVEKPWASGRILTPEQRARKQEADRKANRFLKKEIQDRLALLEARVLELEQTDPSGSKDSAVDLDGDSKAWFLEPGLTGSDRTTNVGVANERSTGVNWTANVPYTIPATASETAQSGSLQSPALTNAGDRHVPGSGFPTDHSTVYYHPRSDEPPPNPQQPGSEVPPDFTDVTTSARTRPDGRHMTCFLNNLVNYIRSMAPGVVCFDDRYNQDLIVASVLKGWEPTLSRYQQRCPLWDILRLVDSYLFKDCNFVERISVLRMLHRRYLFEVNANLPTAGPPPPWFRPQFSEKVFFHDPVIDHLTWPRLRQRLIASEQDKLTNRFWALFVKNLRVTLRYEPIEIMTFSMQLQLYQLTAGFESAIMDMANWRMDMDFFRGLPQLAGDVPPYNYMPLRTVAPKLGPTGARQTLSPQFGAHQMEQDSGQPIPQMQHIPQAEETVAEETWLQQAHVQPGISYPDNSQLENVKMTPGMWNNFYS